MVAIKKQKLSLDLIHPLTPGICSRGGGEERDVVRLFRDPPAEM
jgi:hypothetical protein